MKHVVRNVPTVSAFVKLAKGAYSKSEYDVCAVFRD